MTDVNKERIPWQVRPIHPQEQDAMLDVVATAFGAKSHTRVDKFNAMTESGTAFVVVDPAKPEQIAGCYVGFPIHLSLPGHSHEATRSPGVASCLVTADAVTWVTVRPDLRRKGVLSAMMEHHKADARERGVGWSVLWAIEAGVYGKFGYASAGPAGTLTVPGGALEKQTSHLRDRYSYQLVAPTDQALATHDEVWQRESTQSVGTVRWTSTSMTSVYTKPAPPPSTELDPQVALLKRDGRAVASAIVYRRSAWQQGEPAGSVDAALFVAESDEARMVLAHYLSSFDLFTSTDMRYQNPHDVVVQALGGQERANLKLKQGMWFQMTDPVVALESRGYAKPLDLVLRINDPQGVATGTYRLTADGVSSAACVAVDEAPDLTCSTAAISGMVLGRITPQLFSSSCELGLLEAEEHTPGALCDLAEALQTPQLTRYVGMF